MADNPALDPANKFPELAAMDVPKLLAERQRLIGDRLTVNELPLDDLYKISAIATLLRRKSSGPPRDAKPVKEPKAPKSSGSKLSDDDLFVD
jgi:hypothetical protein